MLLGRTRDRDDIVRLIREAKGDGSLLLTIVGPPGVGKSLLAREVVAFTKDPSLMPVMVDDADAMGIDAAIAAVEHERKRAQNVVLVTSRERLRLRGEVVVRIEPLPDDVAVALFEERARRVDRTFQIKSEDEPQLRALMRELDGLPLLIELAAERVGTLSIQAILGEVERDRFAFLRTRNRDVMGRSASLTEAIEGSWTTLTKDERSALVRSSVFAGSFSLEAARAVLEGGRGEGTPPGGDAHDAHDDAIDRLESLVDKSLITTRRRGQDVRFVVYRCVRELVRKRGAHDELTIAEEAHAKFFTTRPTVDEMDDVILAVTRSKDRIASARAILALEHALAQKGPLHALLSLIDAQPFDAVPEAWRLRLLVARARTLRRMGRAEDALGPLKAAAALVNDPVTEEIVSLARKEIEQTLGRDTGVEVPATGDASADVFAAVIPPRAMDLVSAKHAAEKALQAAKRKSESRTEAIIRTRLAAYCLQAKELDAATEHVTLAIATHRAVGAALHEGVASYVAGLIEVEREDPVRAAASFADVEARANELDSSLLRGYAHRGQALLAMKIGAATLAEQELRSAAVELTRAGDRVTLADVEAMMTKPPPTPAAGPATAEEITLTLGVTWFQIGSGERVDLARRRALRLMLHHLAAHRSATLDAIVKASWPGERILPTAASARVWTAIRTLRALGLHRELLLTTDAGYALADHVHVRHRIE